MNSKQLALSNSLVRFLIVLSVTSFLMFGCTKKAGIDAIDDIDDTPGSTTPVPTSPNDVSPFQVVEVAVESSLSKDNYKGTIGGIAIELFKNDSGHLEFMIPYEIELGSQTLRIPELNNWENIYNVIPSPLQTTATPEFFNDLISDIKDRLPSTLDNADDPAIKEVLDGWDLLVSNASDEEKIRLSMFYLQHETTINELLYTDYTDIGEDIVANQPTGLGRMGAAGAGFSTSSTTESGSYPTDRQTNALLTKFSVSLVIAGGGAYLIKFGVGMDRAFGVGAAIIGVVKAHDYHTKLMEHNINAVDFAYDKITNDLLQGSAPTRPLIHTAKAASAFGASSLTSSDSELIEIEFEKEVALPISLLRRPITAGDTPDEGNHLKQSFLALHEQLASIVENMNTAITWVNTYVPFVNYKLIPDVTLPTEVEDAHYPLTAEMLTDMNISMSGHAEFISYRLGEEGELLIKVKPSNGQKHTLDLRATLSLSIQNRYIQLDTEFPVAIDACSAVPLLISQGKNPKDILQSWYEAPCVIGLPYAGGLIGSYDTNIGTGSWTFVIVAPQPIGVADYPTAVSLARGYSGGGYSDWSLPDLESRTSSAIMSILDYYAQNGVSVAVSEYLWRGGIAREATDTQEAAAWVQHIPRLYFTSRDFSTQNTVWPVRDVSF